MTFSTHTVRVPDGPAYQICLPPAGLDPVADEMAAGVCPQVHNWDLFLSLLRPGDTVLDLGAHLGSFALPAAALGCRVIAVEASPANAGLLRASAEANGFGPDRLEIVHAAVSDRPGEIGFDAAGPFGTVATGGGGVRVPAVAVDGLLKDRGVTRVGFVKMDVEGWEPVALGGMRRVLGGTAAPPVFYESNGFTLHKYGRTSRDLRAAVEALGYRNHHVDSGNARLVPVSADDLQPECCVDYLAVKPATGWRALFRPAAARVGKWPVAAARTRGEWLALAHTCCDGGAFWPHREHAVREIAGGPEWLRADPVVRAFLASQATATRQAG